MLFSFLSQVVTRPDMINKSIYHLWRYSHWRMIWSFIISSYLLLCGVARAMSMMHSSLCCHEWMCSLFFCQPCWLSNAHHWHIQLWFPDAKNSSCRHDPIRSSVIFALCWTFFWYIGLVMTAFWLSVFFPRSNGDHTFVYSQWKRPRFRRFVLIGTFSCV